MSENLLGDILDDEFWSNRFHFCALAAGCVADSEGRLRDSEYVRQLAYKLFEEGAFKEEVPAEQPPG